MKAVLFLFVTRVPRRSRGIVASFLVPPESHVTVTVTVTIPVNVLVVVVLFGLYTRARKNRSLLEMMVLKLI